MSAAQAMEGVSTRVSTLLVLTSVSVEVDIHYLAIRRLVMVFIIIIIYFHETICMSKQYNMYPFSDINECTSRSHNCAQVCINTAGSFTCSCNSGHTLAADGHSCTGIVHVSISNNQ